VSPTLVVQHEDHAPLGALEAPLLERGLELCVWRPDRGDPVPVTLDEVDAIVSLGGHPHPDQDDRHPWLGVQRALLRDALAAGVPTLGVCLGAQLVAQAAGAQAGPAPEGEVGWVEVDTEPAARDDRLFADLPTRFPALEWHHYRFALPPGATLLARTPRAIQAFRSGANAWGVQFHVEADEPIIADWLVRGREEMLAYGVDPARVAADTAANAAGYAAVARALALRFGDAVAEFTAARAVATAGA
jgi:GMP synthase-like glutamine amidotransferase